MGRKLGRELFAEFYWASRFVKTAWLAAPFAMICVVVFFGWIFPLASAESIRAGLTLIAEILGVVVGAVLVILGLLIDQLRQSETLLAGRFHHYRSQILNNSGVIKQGREQFIAWIMSHSGNSLQDFARSPYDYVELKKCVSALSALSVAAASNHIDDISPQLTVLGFSAEEISEILRRADLFMETPYRFFGLVSEALLYIQNIPIFIWNESLERFTDFRRDIITEMTQEGLIAAVNRYHSTTDFFGSWTLPLSIAVDIVALLISIFTIFGVTETSMHSVLVRWLVYCSLLGFLLSVVLLSISLRKMLDVGAEKQSV